MVCRTLLLTFLVALMLLPGAAFGQFEPKIVARGKKATALVVLPSARGFASAFCIDEAGYFFTNEHVVRAARGSEIKLVLNAAEKNQRTIDATVVRVDKDNDLALLKTVAKVKLTALPLGDAKLTETEQIIVFGYPFGTALKVKDQQYPNISINVGRVTSLRISNGRLEQIQIDAEINPGNSGGPVLNRAGEVVGVVHAKVGATAVNFAVPVGDVKEFLATPEIIFNADRIDHERRYDAQQFTVRVVPLKKPRPKYDVRLRLGEGKSQREVALKHQKKDTYEAKAIVLKKSGKSPRLPVEITFSQGTMRGEVDDAKITAGETGALLSELARIDRQGDGWQLTRRNFEKEVVKQVASEKLTVHVGKPVFDVAWNDVKSIVISPPQPERGIIPYEIIVRSGGKQVASKSGELLITGQPAKQGSGPFISLDGRSAWPSYLETPPIGATKDGLTGLGRRYVRTESGRFLDEDFTFEVIFSIKRDEGISFIGLGEGRGIRANDEPGNSVNFRFHSPGRNKGMIRLAKLRPTDANSHIMGNVREEGEHRVTISKQGNRVTFAVDVDNDGPTADDMEVTFPNIRDYAPFLHEKNTHLFIGGDGTFRQVRLTGGSQPDKPKDKANRRDPRDADDPADDAQVSKDHHRFTDKAAEQLNFESATLERQRLIVKSGRVVRTRKGDWLDSDFRFEVVLTVPEKTDRKPQEQHIFVGIGEGRYNRSDLDNSVRLRLNQPSNGGVMVGYYPQKNQTLGNIRQAGTHRIVIQKRGNAVTFTVDVDNDGDTDDDLQSTIPNIREFASFLHGKNSFLFFGGDARFHSFSLVKSEPKDDQRKQSDERHSK